MKRYLLLVMALFVGSMTFAQHYIAPDPNPRQKEEAMDLANQIDDRLSLTEKQLLLVENLNGEFIARRDFIIGDQEISIIEKNELLEAIYVEQGNEMADILVREQLVLYKKIRGELQPLVTIKE